MKDLPVRPELFDILIDYASQIDRGGVEKVIENTSPLLTFCQNFYAQFFQNELDTLITGIDPDNKRVAIRLRLKKRRSPIPTESVELIKWFERLCDIKDDVLAIVYGATPPSTFLSFHQDYMTTVLDRALAWATVRKFASLREKTEATISIFSAAIRKLHR